MHTYTNNGKLYNRVNRLHDFGECGVLDRVIIDEIPGGQNHNGGRIGFGPDGMLYITTGETFNAELAQNLDSLVTVSFKQSGTIGLCPPRSLAPNSPFREL